MQAISVPLATTTPTLRRDTTELASMDPQTAKVAIQLQLEDIAQLLDNLYASHAPSAENVRASLETMQRDLMQQLTVIEGQVIVVSILKDEYNERFAFKKLLEEEKQALSDHQLAMRLAGIPFGAADVASFGVDYDGRLEAATDRDEYIQWEMARHLYAVAFDGDSQPPLEGGPVQPTVGDREPLHGIRTNSAKQENNKILDSKDLIKCNACLEIVSTRATLQLQCTHTYCRPCLLDLFTSAISNPTLFPPRCCRVPIPLETCRATLPRELIKEFDLKVEELATTNPTYCANANCSKFIRPKDIVSDVGSCVFCRGKTCVQCKNQSHDGLCPSDPHVQLLMDAAKRSKWQQCTKCNNMVELSQGCFHMTCRCKHQFCYLCGVAWKRCTCPQWEEHYLTNPTPVALPVAQLGTARAGAPAARATRHVHDWVRNNQGTCQDYGADWLPWVMQCSGCNFASCWRCIHNRD